MEGIKSVHLGIALLGGVDVPDDVARQADDLVPSLLGHSREAFRLGLVLEGVTGEVDPYILEILVSKTVTARGIRMAHRSDVRQP